MGFVLELQMSVDEFNQNLAEFDLGGWGCESAA